VLHALEVVDVYRHDNKELADIVLQKIGRIEGVTKVDKT